MRALVTGSAGHLGEALMRTLGDAGAAIGLDIAPSPFTERVGSIVDRAFVRDAMEGVDTVFHAATLHKPHVATHSRQAFVDTNVAGTLALLEEAHLAGVRAFVFTSSTSVFGDALRPGDGAPAVWVTEELAPIPKNIYGVTKRAAEDLCQLFHRNRGLPCVVLRTSRFFPEDDDDASRRAEFASDNLKVNELLNRRADVADIVDAHLLAAERAPELGFARYVVSAPTPFSPEDTVALRRDAPSVVTRRAPGWEAEYERRGWRMPRDIGRVYDSSLARVELGWEPRLDFGAAIERLARDEDWRSPLARAVGAKGYHEREFEDGPYPVEP